MRNQHHRLLRKQRSTSPSTSHRNQEDFPRPLIPRFQRQRGISRNPPQRLRRQLQSNPRLCNNIPRIHQAKVHKLRQGQHPSRRKQTNRLSTQRLPRTIRQLRLLYQQQELHRRLRTQKTTRVPTRGRQQRNSQQASSSTKKNPRKTTQRNLIRPQRVQRQQHKRHRNLQNHRALQLSKPNTILYQGRRQRDHLTNPSKTTKGRHPTHRRHLNTNHRINVHPHLRSPSLSKLYRRHVSFITRYRETFNLRPTQQQKHNLPRQRRHRSKQLHHHKPTRSPIQLPHPSKQVPRERERALGLGVSGGRFR